LRSFERVNDAYAAVFEPEEAHLLVMLAGQIAEIVASRDSDDSQPDPAVLRLLPDAYPEDPEASAEFRRFTADGLASRKVANASRMTESLAIAAEATSTTEVLLDDQTAQAWLRTLTDIRLTLAVRLGIEKDEDAGSGDPELVELYDWLGFVQATLVEALDD
jgi:hypothetical protein